MTQENKKNLFPIINFFDAKASSNFNLDNGKIEIIPAQDSNQIFKTNPEIAFALPNEEIQIKSLTYKREKFYFLNALKGNLNPNRAKAPCKHFETCGGCLYQHMQIDFYKNLKLSMLKKIFIDFSLEKEIEKFSEIKVIGPLLRRKANFEALKKNGEIFLGFHRFGSRQIINIDSCEIMNPKISNLLKSLKDLCLAILEEFQKCEFFILLAENGLDIGFEIHGSKILSEKSRFVISEFCKNSDDVIRFFFKAGKNQEILYEKQNSESPFVFFGKYKVCIDSYSFLQTSKEAENEILESIQEFFPENHEKLSLIDLFCGRGLYALNFENQFNSVYGFELDTQAIKDFAAAVKENNLIDKIKIFQHNLFDEPILENFFNENQFVVINPPRAGAKKVCEQISWGRFKPKNLVYVSCNPKTFVTDAKILLENGFKISKINIIDQFIWSNHLELIAHFSL
jgi:23S rRNA (uracil1939-C5)-methyltransferase